MGAYDLSKESEMNELFSEGGGPAVIDFWSPTCGPCKMMAPAYDAVATEMEQEGVRFLKLNTAKHPQLAAPFRIRAVPTLLFVNNGEVLDVRVGALDADGLRKKGRWLASKARGEGLLSRLFKKKQS
jgi:thioredoxin